MLRNYLTVALRNVFRNKLHTGINVTGLAVGMATCILIMLWITDELSFDRFHHDADRIYRLCHELTMAGTTRRAPTGSDPMAPIIQAACPEVAAITRLNSGKRTEISYGDRRFFEENILYADSQFFSVFTFPLVEGDPRIALAARHSVVITREIARKYFGDEYPIGKTLRFGANDDYTVTGVIDRVPSNSHLSFDILVSYRTLFANDGSESWRWGTLSTFTYLRTAPNTTIADVEGKIATVIGEKFTNRLKERGVLLSVFLQPLTAIHLHSSFDGEEVATRQGSVTHILLFTAVAFGVLLIACANFINLTTAGSVHRVREIGVRKTFGADHSRLTFQLLMESVLLSLAALVIALIFVELALPSFNAMTEHQIEMNYLDHLWIIPGFILFAILVGILAGIYPAMSLSSMNTAAGLKGLYLSAESRSILRRVLVIGQYAISIALIISTLMIYSQVKFMKNKNLGFADDQLLVLRGLDNWPTGSAATLKSEIAQTPGVIQTSLSSSVPGENAFMTNFRPEGPSAEDMLMIAIYADESSQPTFGLELAAGRNFSREMGADSTDALLINEAAARKLGWSDPVGKTIGVRTGTGDKTVLVPRKIIGVVRDFHYVNLYEPIEPLVIVWASGQFYKYLSVRIETANISGTLDLIRSRWERLANGAPFDYFFADQQFAEQYKSEERLGKISISFSALAIFVACLGLFGMASHVVRRRTKEMGVRKVLGATVRGVAVLLAADLVKWVLLANVIAWPIAYHVMNRWMQTFAYRTSIGPGVFILSGALTLAMALATVGYHAVRAARANPVDSLKYE